MSEMAHSSVARVRRVNTSPLKVQPAVAPGKYVAGDDLRDYPMAFSRERQLLIIPDAILEFYAFLFCQGQYLSLGMTFEHFLLVVTSVRLDHGFAT
jgi:hypothetical protein